jgi:flagellar biosynthesis/type III secretory pathway protein FliH
VQSLGIGGLGQDVPESLEYRQAREHEIAEARATAPGPAEEIESRAEQGLVAGEQRRQLGHLIGTRAIVELGHVLGHLLQTDDIGIAQPAKSTSLPPSATCSS